MDSEAIHSLTKSTSASDGVYLVGQMVLRCEHCKDAINHMAVILLHVSEYVSLSCHIAECTTRHSKLRRRQQEITPLSFQRSHDN